MAHIEAFRYLVENVAQGTAAFWKQLPPARTAPYQYVLRAARGGPVK